MLSKNFKLAVVRRLEFVTTSHRIIDFHGPISTEDRSKEIRWSLCIRTVSLLAPRTRSYLRSTDWSTPAAWWKGRTRSTVRSTRCSCGTTNR